jgi:two-component system LytT family sensor kinase
VILIVIFAVREFRVRRAGKLRAAELAGELAAARLRHLTAQIEPHFLFNSLNAISNRMREDVDTADRMISHLGDLLRAAYDTDDQVIVPLGRELEWFRGYAAMMSERFRGQLAFELAVESGLEAIRVPRLPRGTTVTVSFPVSE